MKVYKSSALTHKRAEVLEEAKANGVIIQECKTNGDVRQEFVLYPIHSDSWVIVDDQRVLPKR